jgi:hydrogenase nickel incorporation protein HypA/HybF
MHEYSVTRELVDLCNREAEQHDMQHIHCVYIKIGKFTGFSADAIRFYFEYLCPGTRCENAELIFRDMPIQIKCRSCLKTSTIEEPVMICPVCQGSDLEIMSGRELAVESIEGE